MSGPGKPDASGAQGGGGPYFCATGLTSRNPVLADLYSFREDSHNRKPLESNPEPLEKQQFDELEIIKKMSSSRESHIYNSTKCP